MKNRKSESRKSKGLQRGLSLLLMACMLMAALHSSLASDADLAAVGATSAGSSPGSISPSSPKVYVKLSKDTNIFKSTEASTGTTVKAGTVLQLVANKYYTAGGINYYCLYYNNLVWNVLAGDVYSDIMSTTELSTYITGTLWGASSFSSLNSGLNLVGDVRVHGLQLALSVLGHYTGAMDGNFGSGTESAIKAFQRANKLEVDGRAGPITQALLYPMALGTASSGGSSGSSSSSGSSGGSGTLTTTDSVNLRKGAGTKTARLAVVPKKTSLTYVDTATSGGVTWYKVVYNGLTGWLMGTFVSAGGSSGSSGSSSSGTQIGTVTITMASTRVRKTPNGDKTGVVLAKGTVVPLLAQPTTAGGYTWYNIRTSSGVVGYVRSDCAKASTDGGTSGVVPSSTKTYIKLSSALSAFTTEERPSSGFTNIPAGTVIQMVSPTTYTKNGVEYCSLYYNNKSYNAVYSDVKSDIMTDTELLAYITGTLWKAAFSTSLKEELGLKGDIRVHSLQLALSLLGYYNGALDGSYGGGTTSAVRNFQRAYKLDVDGSVGPKTWVKLFPAAITAYNADSGSGGGESSGGTVVTDFGTVNSVEKATWSTVDGGIVSLFKKGTSATVMDTQTGRVFTIYRWSGGSHADCVPLTSADTKVMCEIVGFPYNSSAPTSSQLSQIKADSSNSNYTYTWPDFRNSFGGGKNIGSDWDRRPALLNVSGRVFAVSIYGWPHGFNGTDSFSLSKFSNGTYFYAQNNYYGMMCIHFVGSTTHSSSTPDSNHQAAIEAAYSYAKSKWPTLCK